MIKLLFIFLLSVIYNQNFSYSDDDWITITSPKKINSISYSNDDVFIASVNGLFGYDTFNMNFYFIDDAFRYIKNKEIFVVYHDSYRDHLWILNDYAIYFKSINSDIWREIDINLYLNIPSSKDILNIGSNYDNIYIETSNYILRLNPYSGNLLDSEIKNNFNIDNNIKWSSTAMSALSDFVDLRRYFSTENWNVVDRNTLEHKGREIKITCVKEIDNNMVVIGTDSGELFYAETHLNRIEKISSVPTISNIKVAYPDNFDEWWFSDNDWFYLDREFRYEREVVFLLRWDEQNNLWTEYYQNEYPGILSKDINRIIRKDNFLYIATGYGFMIFDIINNNWKLYDTRNGLPTNNVIDLSIYNNMIYLATSKGLVEFSIKLNKPIGYYSKQILKNCEIFDIEKSDNLLYVVSSHGFYLIDLKTNLFQFLSEKIFFKLSVHNEHIALATKNKVYKYNNNKFNFLFKNPNIKNLNYISEYIWTHNKNSATLYDIKNDRRYDYNYMDGIPGDIIYNFNCNEDWICFNTNNGITFYNWSKFHYYEN